MTTEEIRVEWAKIRPMIGNLICLIDGKTGSLDDLDQVKKVFYEKGLSDGRKENTDAEYERGVKDGWNACMRIWDYDSDYDVVTLVSILGECYDLKKVSPMDVVERLEAYDAEQREMMLLAKEKAVDHDLKELVKKHGYNAVVHGVEMLEPDEDDEGRE